MSTQQCEQAAAAAAVHNACCAFSWAYQLSVGHNKECCSAFFVLLQMLMLTLVCPSCLNDPKNAGAFVLLQQLLRRHPDLGQQLGEGWLEAHPDRLYVHAPTGGVGGVLHARVVVAGAGRAGCLFGAVPWRHPHRCAAARVAQTGCLCVW